MALLLVFFFFFFLQVNYLFHYSEVARGDYAVYLVGVLGFCLEPVALSLQVIIWSNCPLKGLT